MVGVRNGLFKGSVTACGKVGKVFVPLRGKTSHTGCKGRFMACAVRGVNESTKKERVCAL